MFMPVNIASNEAKEKEIKAVKAKKEKNKNAK